MARSNRTLIVVVGIGAALGLAAGLFYLLVLGPRQAQRAAQDEVERWGQSWATARTCLVGDQPPLRDGAAAYFVREAVGAPAEALASCDELLYGLKREADFGSGDSTLEGAWLDLQAPVRELAKALSWRTAVDKPRPLSALIADLAAAIAAMDAAYAELRDAAGLEPPVWPGAELPAAEARPLLDGAVEWLAVGAGGFAARLGGDAPRLVVRDGDGESALPLSAWVEPSRHGGWGMWRERDGEILARQAQYGEAPATLRAGPLDAQGDPAGAGVVLEAPGALATSPLFAAGSGEQRAALYRVVAADGSMALRLRRSSDGGQSWSAPIEVSATDGAQIHIDEVARRTDIAWIEDGASRWLAVTGAPAAPQTVSRTADYATLPTCTAGDSGWWLRDGQLFHAAGDDKPAAVVPAPFSPALVRASCTAERFTALVADGDHYALHHCSRDGCERGPRARLTPLAPAHVAALGDGLAVVTAAGDVLLAWRPGQDGFGPVAQLAPGEVLEGIYADGDEIMAVLRGDGGYRLAAL